MNSIERYLYENMPLTRAMGLKVIESEICIKLEAPLAPNLNHKKTAFGGSISTALITAGWLEVRRQLLAMDLMGEIVIQESKVEFLKPINTDFAISAKPVSAQDGLHLKKMMEKFSRGRVTVESYIGVEDGPAALFSGVFVAFRGK